LRKAVPFQKGVRKAYGDCSQYHGKEHGCKAIKKDFKISHKSMAIFIGAGILAAIIGLALGYFGAVSKVSSLTIDGIQCNPSEQLLLHVHAHLDININGQYYLVPSQVGITNACYFWLHTHDVSGIIHIESPVNRDFTLVQFFGAKRLTTVKSNSIIIKYSIM
jgi:hypothetical protein